VTSEDRITQGVEVAVGKGRLRPSGNEDFLWPVRGREQDSVLNPAIPHPVDGRPHGVFDLPDGFSVDRPLNHVPLELFHVPSAVDLEVSPEIQQAAVGDQESAALHRKDDQRSLVGFQMSAKQGESVRIPLRRPSRPEEHDAVERIRVLHSAADGLEGHEGSREGAWGSLK